MYGLSVGTLCEGGKALAIPFAEKLIRDLEAEGLVESSSEAEEYRQLADTLLRETSRRQWSLAPHSATPFIARTFTLSWKPREANT